MFLQENSQWSGKQNLLINTPNCDIYLQNDILTYVSEIVEDVHQDLDLKYLGSWLLWFIYKKMLEELFNFN